MDPFVPSLTADPKKHMPIIDTWRDTGYFVRDLVQSPPRKNVLAYGSMLSCKEYMAFWARIQKPFGGYYKQITTMDLIDLPLAALAASLWMVGRTGEDLDMMEVIPVPYIRKM